MTWEDSTFPCSLVTLKRKNQKAKVNPTAVVQDKVDTIARAVEGITKEIEVQEEITAVPVGRFYS